MILNEIQPRDTNDYFNQAKILKEHDSFDLEDLNANVPNIDTSAEIKGSLYKNQYCNQCLFQRKKCTKFSFYIVNQRLQICTEHF